MRSAAAGRVLSRPIRAPTPAGVTLSRDDHGIPQVVAEDLSGVYWGMGYCHALDRPLQMLMMRVLGQEIGRASCRERV